MTLHKSSLQSSLPNIKEGLGGLRRKGIKLVYLNHSFIHSLSYICGCILGTGICGMLLSSKDLHKQARAFLCILMPAEPASAS